MLRVRPPSGKETNTNAHALHEPSRGAPNLWKLCSFYWLTDSSLQSDRTPPLWDMPLSQMLTKLGESQGFWEDTRPQCPGYLLLSLPS